MGHDTAEATLKVLTRFAEEHGKCLENLLTDIGIAQGGNYRILRNYGLYLDTLEEGIICIKDIEGNTLTIFNANNGFDFLDYIAFHSLKEEDVIINPLKEAP